MNIRIVPENISRSLVALLLVILTASAANRLFTFVLDGKEPIPPAPPAPGRAQQPAPQP